VNELEWLADADLSAQSTLRLSSHARWQVRVRSRTALSALCADSRFKTQASWILGGGSNVLLAPSIAGIVIQPCFAELVIKPQADHSALFCVEAGMQWHDLVLRSVSEGWRGLENLALIPGHCGAAPIQNIGAYGSELCESLEEVEIFDLDSGQTSWLGPAELKLGYRDSVFKHTQRRWLITRLLLRLHRDRALRTHYSGLASELADIPPDALSAGHVMRAVMRLRQRKLPDPAREPNAGSYFQNPVLSAAGANRLLAEYSALPHWPQRDGSHKVSAAWLIEHSGLKGYRLGPCRVSQQHALVLINEGGDCAALLRLQDHVVACVLEKFSLRLQREPVLLGAAA